MQTHNSYVLVPGGLPAWGHICLMFCFPLNLFIFHIYDSSPWAILAGGLQLVGNHGMVSLSHGMTQWSSTRGVLCVFRGSGGATLDKNAVPGKDTHLKRFRDCASPSKKKKRTHSEQQDTTDAGATARWFSLVGHTSPNSKHSNQEMLPCIVCDFSDAH